MPTYGSPPGYVPPHPGAPGYGGPPPGYGYQQAPPGYGYPPAGYGPRPPYASWIQRVGGALIDGLIVGVPAAILYIAGLTVGFSAQSCAPDENGYPVCTGGGLSGAGWILIVLGWVIAVAGGLYLTYLVGTTGQTPGKRMVGIRLIREADGQVLGFGMAFVRNLCHVLDSFCYIGYLWPLWDDKRQTFADKIMKTIVVEV
ncbi:RDD family protein [Nocardia sp. CA2R105]|uniref:RDD family protein n=1 Tax=Nocardia coffeae TaxID=2873381 RepID=UPI001CA6E437|nr:RDD family protein [Nocardia coffeae]MBY8862428.1 RDD family protein [Nocardia coffeae]